MKKVYVIVSCVLIVSGTVMCRKANTAAIDDDSRFDPRLSGGAATFFDISAGSFGSAIPGLSEHDERIHELGDALFEQSFVAAPAPRRGRQTRLQPRLFISGTT